MKGVSNIFDRMSPFALAKMTRALKRGPVQEKHIFELTSVKEFQRQLLKGDYRFLDKNQRKQTHYES